MKRFILPALATTTAIALFTCGAPVQAASFAITYDGISVVDGSSPVLYDLTVTGDPTVFDGRPAYLLTSASGTRNGLAIAALLAPNAFFDNDNILFADQPYLSGNGVSFVFADNSRANLGFSDPIPGVVPVPFYFEFTDDGFTSAAPTLTVAPAAVPEAATWVMLLVGFGAIGAAMRSSARSGFAPGLV